MWFNPIVSFLAQSPFHGMLGNTTLITVTGRKTGRQITTPVSYTRDGNELWVISRRDRTWWRNLKSGAEVTLHLGGRDTRACAVAILDEATVTARLEEQVVRHPALAHSLGIRMDSGRPCPEDLCRAAKLWLFIRIQRLEDGRLGP